MTTRIKLRRDTAANWTTNDPVLALGEAGYDTTNNELRVGDGTTVWSGLDAIGGGISNAVAIAPEFAPAVTFARPENSATDAVDAVDVIDTGVALGRNSNQGGLLNTLEDNLDGYNNNNYAGQPTHTEWNTDGLADLSNVTTRTYQDFRAMKQDLGDDAFLATQLVMHDTLNDKYYTFKFSRWSVADNGGDGGYSYVRRLINHTQYFNRIDGDTGTMDTIDTGLVIARGNGGGLYNDDAEVSWNRDVSPQGTEWNIDGWSDLSNLLTRTYTNFASAFSYQIGNRIIGKEAIMHDTINDEYYAVKFTRWGNNGGDGFTWQRRLIDTTQLDEGLHFGDGTVQTTAGVTFNSNGSLNLPEGLTLPYKNNMGYEIGYGLDGPTLQLSNDSENQVIVTGPAPTETYSNARRIVIQGQRGYGSTSTQGEGGDVYIWGGVGGETNNNTEGWNRGGGSGGDIKLRGGEGINNYGGYIRIEAGNTAHFNTSTTGDAGFVEITGGDVIVDNAAGSSRGGDIRITGGRAYSATTQSGVVQVITGGFAGQSGDKIWTFGNDGTLTVPGDILDSDGIGLFASLIHTTNNMWHVDPSRTDTYTANGSVLKPFKTIASALAYIEAKISDSSLVIDINGSIVDNPQFIFLKSSITENVTLTRGNIFIVGETPNAGHIPIWIEGHVTITPANTGTNAINVNRFGLFHVAIRTNDAYHSIELTGSNPTALYLDDVYCYQGNATKSCVYADNTGTDSRVEMNDCTMSRAAGSVYLIDIQRGFCTINNLETNGTGQVLNQANDSTGNMLRSTVDANTGSVVTLSGSVQWGMGEVILNNSGAGADTHGISMSGSATIQFGVCTFNVPVGDGSNRAINGTGTNMVLYADPVFQYGTCNKISTEITLIPLTTTFTAV